MIVTIIVILILAAVYIELPLWLKLIVFAIDAFIPDPIPVVDEVFMVASIIGHVKRFSKLMELKEQIKQWYITHKSLAHGILIGIVVLIVLVILL